MRFVRRYDSTRGQETRTVQAKKGPLQWERLEARHAHQRSLAPYRGSHALVPATLPAPEAGPAPTAGPEADLVATATPPGVAVGVGEPIAEDELVLVAAHTEATAGIVGRTVEVPPEAAHIIAVGGPGLILMTVIRAGVGA